MNQIIKKIIGAAVFVMTCVAMNIMVFAMESTVTVPERFEVSDNPVYGSYTYTHKDKITDTNQGIIIPIYVPKAGVVSIDSAECIVEKNGYAVVYTDEACTNETDYYESFSQGDTAVPGYFVAAKAGTYYLKLYSISYDEQFTNTINFSFCLYSQADRTIKAGKIYALMANSYDSTLYFKYKASKTGYIVVQTSSFDTSKVVLTNAKKKEIASARYMSETNNYAALFPVKKGATYYIKMSSMSKAKLNGLQVTQKAVKEKSGKKKSKAKSIKLKKTVKGTLQYGEKADWYKFTAKKKSVNINVSTENSEYLKISVYDKKGKQIGITRTLFDGNNAYKLTRGKSGKGTYFVKIERAGKKSSGYYELKLK